jgi:starvation-inducible outer membrane lipoprotein
MRNAMILMALLLAGCSAQPVTIAQSRNNIILFKRMNHSMQDVFDTAGAHCRQFGREAILRDQDEYGYGEARINFECQAPR